MKEDCVFCQIVRGEKPASIVYEDEETLAFMDINQGVKGHLLIIPKEHYVDITDITPEAAAAVARTSVQVAPALKRALNADGISVWQANGWAAGQRVFHYHVHLFPRFTGDGLPLHKSKMASREELDRIAELIRKHL